MAEEKKASGAASKKVLDISKKIEGKDDFDIFRRFSMRPAKYNGAEITLPLKILASEAGALRIQMCQAFGLAPGDTIYAMAIAEERDKKGVVKWGRQIAVFAEGKAADWLEEVRSDCLIKARVRLAFATVREVEGRGNNSLIVDNAFDRVILLEVLDG